MLASSHTWSPIDRSEEEAMLRNNFQQLPVGLIPFPNSMYNIGGDQEFPFLDPKLCHQEVGDEVPNYQTVRLPSRIWWASHELTRPPPSRTALSLLSLPTTQFSGISLPQLVHANSTPPFETINGSGLSRFNNSARHSCSPVTETTPFIGPVPVQVEATKANDHGNAMLFHLG